MTDEKAKKIALVTGASRGFGAAVAEELAARGWHVIAVARTSGALEELDDRITARGGTATLVPIDITEDEALQGMCLSIYKRWGHVDLLVHCAIHASPLSPAGHVPESDLDKSLAINIRATQRIIAMVEPLLKAVEGGLAVLPVDREVVGRKFFAAYGFSKAAQQAIWDSWAAETKVIGPRVTTFAPRAMPTATRGRFFPGEDRDALTPTRDEAVRFIESLDQPAEAG